MEEEFTCALCLDFYSEKGDEDYFVCTDCGHLFHYFCLKSSFENNHKECAICRKPLVDLENVRKLFGIHPKGKDPQIESIKLELKDESSTEITEYDYKFKIILVGDSGVGKSSLMQRYCDDVYNTNLFSTVGCDWRSKNLEIGGKKINLSIWDSVGQEKYKSLVTNYVRESYGALVVYDITNSSSITSVEDWSNFVDDYGSPGVIKILIGNKSDLDHHRTVPKPIGKKMAEKLGLPFFETSAKDKYNVNSAFNYLAAAILENDTLIKRIESRKLNPNIQLDSSRYRNSISSGPMSNICSSSFAFARTGLHSTWKGIKSGWNYVTK